MKKIVNLQKWKKQKLQEFEKHTQNSVLEITLSVDVNPARFEIKPECEFWTDDEVMYGRLCNVKNQKIFLSFLADWFYQYSEVIDEDAEVGININFFGED